MTYTEITKKLIGEIRPVGETNTDKERFENLEAMCGLVQDLLGEIITVSLNKDRQEHSLKKAGEYAHNFIYNELEMPE